MPTRSNLDSFKIDHIPDGWREAKGANTAPNGWVWFFNGESRFKEGYSHALVPECLLRETMREEVNHKSRLVPCAETQAIWAYECKICGKRGVSNTSPKEAIEDLERKPCRPHNR